MNRIYALSLLSTLVAAAASQSLVRDIHPGTVNQGSIPGAFTRSGNYAFFFATAGSDFGLWRTDGTAAGTLALRTPQPNSLAPIPPQIADLDGRGTVILAAGDLPQGAEPWVARANPPSITLLRDIVPGAVGSGPRAMLRVGNRVLFGAQTSTGSALWATDGTPAGTVEVTPLQHTLTRAVAALGSVGLFVGQRSVDAALIASDGTAVGTVTLALASADATAVAAVGNRVYFAGYQPASGHELWVTDGTPAGTRLIADLLPGTASSSPQALAAFGNDLLFTTIDRTAGSTSLWRSDGTATGTRVIASQPTVAWGPDEITTVGNVAYFAATTNLAGRELWVTDGTGSGTRQVFDLFPGTADARPRSLFAAGPDLLFIDADLALYRLSGAGLNRIAAFGYYSRPIEFNGQILLAAGASPSELEPTLLLGLSPTTLRDINPALPRSSQPMFFRVGESGTYFLADGGPTVGVEPWFSDGTAAGTRIVADLTPGPASSTMRAMVAVGDRLFLAEGTQNPRLVVSDGVNTTTIAFTPARVGLDAIAAPQQRGALFGLVGSPGLVFTDGTAAGTVGLSNSLEAALGFVAARERVYFLGIESATGSELWVTDGTPANTRMVVDLSPGPMYTEFTEARPLGDRLVFAVTRPTSLQGLWISDGTAAGTLQLARGAVTATALSGDHVYFARDSQLWITDGAIAGTRAIATVGAPVIDAMIAAGPLLYLVTGPNRRELLVTDGSPTGLRLVHTAAPGSYYALNATAGGDLLFLANDGTGNRLWVTDGSFTGTRPLANASSLATDVVATGRSLLFAGVDTAHGAELWRVGFADLQLAVVAPAGRGCPGSNGVPQLSATTAPRVGSLGFGLRSSANRANAAAAIWLSTTRTRIDLPGGCAVYVPPIMAIALRTDATGTATLPLPIPADRALIGTGLAAQAVVADPRGGFAGAVALSHALDVLIGR